MYKAYRYRLKPDGRQRELLNKHFGACRLVYNLGLELKQWTFQGTGESIGRFDLQVQLKEMKEAYPWMYEINSQSLQSALRNLESAFTNFKAGRTSYPRFKRKYGVQSFQCPQSGQI